MSKRLPVAMSEEEYREGREAARRRMTVSEWVRRTLRRGRETDPPGLKRIGA